MKYNPDIHHRRSIRLDHFDYAAAGTYFVNLVVEGRECLFGEIVDGKMQPNSYGKIIEEEWIKSATIRAEIELDAWVLMPNHFHALVIIVEDKTNPQNKSVGAHGRAPSSLPDASFPQNTSTPTEPPRWGSRPRSLSSLMQGFKSATTTRINQLRQTPRTKVWQRSYFEHVVRNENEYNGIRFYIEENPLHWLDDPENPARDMNAPK